MLTGAADYTFKVDYDQLASAEGNSKVGITEALESRSVELHLNFADEKFANKQITKSQYDDALENLKRSIELDDGDYMKFFKLASVYNNLEKWNLAAQSAQSCIDLKKKTKEAPSAVTSHVNVVASKAA